jgi:N6-adenosine-specific RNA methylase IME4
MTTNWPIPPGGYRVVLADPAWNFGLWSEKGRGKSPQRHYDCESIDDIIAKKEELNLDWILAPDCACVLWTTFPMLPQAFRVLAAWGFDYKTGGSWHKRTRNGKRAFGTGYIFRSYAEPFLVGVRGEPPWRARNVRNGFDDAVGRHSEKPRSMYEAIEALLPGPYLELYARAQRPGWDVWGAEVGGYRPAKEVA